MNFHVLIRTLVAGSVLLLAACASNTHSLTMQVPATDDTLSGAMRVGTGPQDVTLTANDGTFACNGVSLLAYAVPGCRTSGSIRLECTDDRDITGNWQMESCTSGHGSGQDSAGNPVAFVIGDTASAMETVERELEVRPGADPGVEPSPAATKRGYLFRLGGGYAVGFDAPGVAEPVFSDAESGLVIVKIDADEMRPLILASDAVLSDGQEAFVLFPSNAITGAPRIQRIRLAGASGSAWEIAGNVRVPAGLPVTNLEGQVVGLTTRDGVLTAGRLRGYLRLVAPGLPEQPVATESVEQLAGRIVAPVR